MDSYALDFHSRLTVVAGLPAADRNGLLNEVVGALGGSHNGVHLELRADNGAQFALFRPFAAPHRLVAIDPVVDVTAQFQGADGEINLLEHAGLDNASARDLMILRSDDLAQTTEREQLVRRLAGVDQNDLWIAAETLRSAQVRLEEQTEAVGSFADDNEVIETIEERHETHQLRRARSERLRKLSFFVSGGTALLAVPTMKLFGAAAVASVVAIATISLITSLVAWRLEVRARRAEELALADFGAQSYLGFQLQRVNGLLASDRSRRSLMAAAETHRAALRRWETIAQGVELSWVFANRDEITAASRVRSDVFGRESQLDELTTNRAANLAHSMIDRLEALRSVGPAHESFTALLDEPFEGLSPDALPPLLELLVRSSEHQQILLLTADPTIASWARLEAMTGVLQLVEPTQAPSDPSGAEREVDQQPVD